MTQHSTGIVGLGIMGRRMLEHMGRHERFAPGLLWDPSAEACETSVAMVEGTRIAASAEEVIAGSDVVYLACPPVPRKAYALAAAAAGKAVFLEKPLGVDVAESRDLVARLEASGVPSAVNFTQAAGQALATVTQDAAMGAPEGVDIVVTYAQWPRAWQREADWLRFGAEGGATREVISHFLFFSGRVLGPLRLAHATASYPDDRALCETHLTARLENADGVPVTVMLSVGGAQPDRQEMTIKGRSRSWRVSEFHLLSNSKGGPFEEVGAPPADPRAVSLKAQLDALDLCIADQTHALATPAEALAVQELVEAMLQHT
ncbi:MAG: Gfo/Idh/MocA family protein [Paracoccaceae bacterium]